MPPTYFTARSSASTATQRLWSYQAGLPTYLFNSGGDGAPDDRSSASC